MNDEIQGKVEYPSESVKVYWKIMVVNGWAFSKNNEDLDIEIFLDEKLVCNASWGIARYDVYQLYNSDPSYESGFRGKFNVETFADGTHHLRVIAKTKKKMRKMKQLQTVETLLHKSELVIGKRESGDKPHSQRTMATGNQSNFKKTGLEYLNYFKKYCNLKPENKILELGQGMGRFTMPLTKYLNDQGEYYGLDIVPDSVKHCQKNITKKFPNFYFLLADVKNKMYNPEGQLQAYEYTFPFKDNFFDLIFLHSVFTHMLLEDMKNYLSEIARVLKPGKQCFISYFLFNTESNNTLNRYNHKHDFGLYRCRRLDRPESAISYDIKLIQDTYKKVGLKIIEPIHYNLTDNAISSQDVIIASKIQ